MICPTCKGRCCRDLSLGYRVVHMGAELYTHACDDCPNGDAVDGEPLREALVEVRQERGALGAETDALLADPAATRAERDKWRAKYMLAEAERDKALRDRDSLSAEVSRLTARCAALALERAERGAEAESKLGAAREERDHWKTRYDSLRAYVDCVEAERDATTRERDALKAQLARMLHTAERLAAKTRDDMDALLALFIDNPQENA